MNIDAWVDKCSTMTLKIDMLEDIAEWAVHDNRQMLLDLNRDQMLLGRNIEGETLSPDYLTDPYFETPQAAQRYATMKAILERRHINRHTYPLNYPEKDRNTPNLIVSGNFQDLMYITITPESFTIGSAYADSGSIEVKYRKKVFGLAPLAKEYFWDHVLYEMMVRHLYNWL